MKKNSRLYSGKNKNSQLINEDEGTQTGIQTMLRLTSMNHIRFSEMADKKANILISVNAIIISVILTVILPRLQQANYLLLPLFLFLITSLSTIIVSIISIRPIMNKGLFKLEDIENKKINLLFFGNFHKMPLQKYDLAMRVMMRDPDYLYSSLVKDIYFLGAVVGKKFKLMRMAYNIFMSGLAVSITAFCITLLLTGK